MDEECKSRTRKKHEDRALQVLGEQLTGLPMAQLETMDLPEDLLTAVCDARKIRSHGAKRRQLRRVGALLRDIDLEPIRTVLENIRLGDYRKALAFQKIESWRDELKAGNTAPIEEIIRTCPDADRQRLMQLVRNAWREAEAGSGVKASRALFRYLRKIGDV
jgi:ribosome-associated protein